jgi:hypothetical protein
MFRRRQVNFAPEVERSLMFISNLIANRRRARRCVPARALSVIAEAVSSVLCEPLERRQLFSTYAYTVPSSHTAAFLTPNATQHRVDVRLDSSSNPVSYTFNNTTGMDIIDAGSNSSFLFVDQVHAVDKPTTDGTDDGIKVQGASGGTLRVEAGDDDTYVEAQTASGNTVVTVLDANSFIGRSRLGSGITNLTLRTNDVAASDYRSNAGDGTLVNVSNLGSGIHLTVDTGEGTYDQLVLGYNNDVAEQAVVKTGAGHDLIQVQLSSGVHATDAIVDFVYAGTLGLGNELDVASEGTARLANAPGTGAHTIYVDEVVVSGYAFNERGTLSVEDTSVIGDLDVTQHGDATAAADTTVTTIEVASGGSASIESPSTIGTATVDGIAGFTSGSAPSTVDHFAPSAGTVTVGTGADVTIQNTSSVSTLVIDDTGVATLTANSAPSRRSL